ncbi:MAG: serine/threonine-protein kinase, partial [Bryobacteraceae bacterium]
PNIARLLTAGHSSDGQPYLAMEYIEGQPIDEFCASLSIRDKIGLMIRLCDAVSYAHRMMVVHRDIKPANVMVTTGGIPKLLDFGIAKLIDMTGEQTMTRDGALTPTYASPEQICGSKVGAASDIYSLGSLLYKLVAGCEPFPASTHVSRQQLEIAVCQKDPPRPSSLNNKVDRDLEFIIQMAMRKEPESRYATVDRFSSDLTAWLEGRPVRARQGGWGYQVRKFARRYRWAVAATVTTALALIVGLGAALREASVARTEAHAAETEAQTSAAVQQFVTDIFETNSRTQNDPVQARQTTARQLLDIGAQRIDRGLHKAPVAKEKMLEYRRCRLLSQEGECRRQKLVSAPH